MTRAHLIKVAKQEMKEWNSSVPRGLVMIILFCFVHRATTGETVEETFFSKSQDPVLDYEI